MKKTIRIDNLEDVHFGDMLFVKGRSDGFRVVCGRPVNVDNPFGHGFAYVNADKFDHAERTIEEPEWPQPSDHELHVYLGADGKRYICNPCNKRDPQPWTAEKSIGFADRQVMARVFPEALPLKELKLVQEEEES